MGVIVTTGASQGPQGRDGNGAVDVSLDSLSATPRSVTDWGPIINTAIGAGTKHFKLGDFDYPFSTPLACSGLTTSIVFEGSRGRGWYVASGADTWGTRLIWTGGASPTVTKTDGAMTSGSKVLNSASAPFTDPSSENVYHNGQPITVHGAGPAGADLVTQIASVGLTTQATLADAASTTVSGVTFSFTKWTSAINGRGSTGLEFRNMKVICTNVAFDGILIDMRSAFTWAAKGLLRDCVVSGYDTAKNAYALLHLNGHGEQFQAIGTTFGFAKGLVRGHYNNNADDAEFVGCAFSFAYSGQIINPGRFWAFRDCFFGAIADATVGPAFTCDGVAGVPSFFTLDNCSFWDWHDNTFPIINQKAGYTWTIEITGANTLFWTNPTTPDIVLNGPGSVNIRYPNLVFDKNTGVPFIDLGDPLAGAQKGFVDIKLSIGNADRGYIAHADGHTDTRIRGAALPELEYVSGHRTIYATNHDVSLIPSVAASSGQTATVAVYGNDEAGIITAVTDSTGAIAGKLVDFTFAHPWPSHAAAIDANMWGAPCVILTPCKITGGNNFPGANPAATVAAGGYVDAADNDTGWSLAIANAVTGVKYLAWFYRVIKL